MNYRLIFILSVILFGFLSCNKDEESCESVIENSGIIIESVDFICDIPYRDNSFIIDSQNELDSIINLNSGCNQPIIDFAQYTLLGNYAYASCKGSYYREVTADTTNLQYDYTITVKSCGECDLLYENMNWVLVPKLPDDWTVKFTLK